MVEALERHGLANDTLVIISSDNGPWNVRPHTHPLLLQALKLVCCPDDRMCCAVASWSCSKSASCRACRVRLRAGG